MGAWGEIRSKIDLTLLLVVGIILLIIAIAGGVIIHPVLFALAIVSLVLWFTGR